MELSNAENQVKVPIKGDDSQIENQISTDDLKRARHLVQNVKARDYEDGISDIMLGLTCLLMGFGHFGLTIKIFGVFALVLFPILGIVFLTILYSTISRKKIESRGYVKPRFPVLLFGPGSLILSIILLFVIGVDNPYPVIPFILVLWGTTGIAFFAGVSRFLFYMAWQFVSFGISYFTFSSGIDFFQYPWLVWAIFASIPYLVIGGGLLLTSLKEYIKISEQVSGMIDKEDMHDDIS